MSTDPTDASQVPYRTAHRSPRACTDAELTALSASFKAKVDANEAVLASAWQNEVSDKCADCVFSDGKDAKRAAHGRFEGPIRAQCITGGDGNDAAVDGG